MLLACCVLDRDVALKVFILLRVGSLILSLSLLVLMLLDVGGTCLLASELILVREVAAELFVGVPVVGWLIREVVVAVAELLAPPVRAAATSDEFGILLAATDELAPPKFVPDAVLVVEFTEFRP